MWRRNEPSSKASENPPAGLLPAEKAGGAHPADGDRPEHGAAVFNAHRPDHYQLLYDPGRNYRQLWRGVRQCQHRGPKRQQQSGGDQLYFQAGEPEIHPGYGVVQAVLDGAVQQPLLSAEILELRDFNGAHCGLPGGAGIAGGLWILEIPRQGSGNGVFRLYHFDAHALSGNAGAQLSGE